MSISIEKISVTVAGTAGSATGTATSRKPICGQIQQIHVVYTTQAATCDVVIATQGKGAESIPTFAILTLTNNNTTGIYRPHYIIHDETGGPLTGTAGGDRHAPFTCDYITVTVAESNAGSVDVYIIYSED